MHIYIYICMGIDLVFCSKTLIRIQTEAYGKHSENLIYAITVVLIICHVIVVGNGLPMIFLFSLKIGVVHLLHRS